MQKFLLPLLLLFPLVAQNKPNVLMIVLDDLNDYVGVMGGHPQAQTPNIDRLAKSGILFSNAHSNAPVCSPSRASFMTGIAPHNSQNYGFENWLKNEKLINSKTLPELMRENGYDAFQTGKILHNKKNGIWTQMGSKTDYGPYAFDGKKTVTHPSCSQDMAPLGALDSTYASLKDIPTVPSTNETPGYSGWMNHSFHNKKPFKYIDDDNRDLMTDEKSFEWYSKKIDQLEKKKNTKPFLFSFGVIRPHSPFVVPQKYFDRFPLNDIQLPKIKKNDIQDCKLASNGENAPRGRVAYHALLSGTDDALREHKKYLQAYLASVSFADEIVGKIINKLDNSKFKDNTVVILFSDHGYSFGEKDYLWKYSLWEESTRVPFIVRAPQFKHNRGKTVDHPISLIDVYPTLQDLCQLKGETKINHKGVDPDGHSLKPFLEDPENGSWNGPDIALSTIASYKSKRGIDQHNSVRSKNYRYIRYANGEEELYHHQKDPHEWNNLAYSPEYKSIKDKLYAKMLDLLTPKKEPESETLTAAQWKDQYFKKHPEADSNKDGELSWPEYHQHKKKS